LRCSKWSADRLRTIRLLNRNALNEAAFRLLAQCLGYPAASDQNLLYTERSQIAPEGRQIVSRDRNLVVVIFNDEGFIAFD
jgi:hypothetical protein